MPIVVLTSSASSVSIEEAEKAGADLVLRVARRRRGGRTRVTPRLQL